MTDYKIDIKNCPKEEPIKIFYPDGTLLMETDHEYELAWVRREIAKNVLEGYYVEFRGNKYPINHYGVIYPYPDGLLDLTEKFSTDTLQYGIATKQKEDGDKEE